MSTKFPTSAPVFCAALMLAGMTTAVLAADAPAGPWSGSIAGGYTAVDGNSENSAGNAKAEAKYKTGQWQHTLGGSAISAGQRDNDTGLVKGSADAFAAGWKTQYDFSERFYAFGSVDWLKDRFSAYDHQLYEAGGLGWHAIKLAKHVLDIEIGPGVRQSKFQVDPDGAGPEDRDQNEAVGLLRGAYTWTISDNASFGQKLSVVSGSDNTYWETGSEVKAGIIGNIALVLGYTLKHNSDVLPGVKKTDKFTTVSLEYKF